MYYLPCRHGRSARRQAQFLLRVSVPSGPQTSPENSSLRSSLSELSMQTAKVKKATLDYVLKENIMQTYSNQQELKKNYLA